MTKERERKDKEREKKHSNGERDGKERKHANGERKKRRSSAGGEKGKTRRSRKRGAEVKVMTVSWNMGNAMSDCFDRIIPFQGGNYDIIALGLQESTYTIKTSGVPSSLGGVGEGAGQRESKARNQVTEDDCVLQLVAQVKEVLTDEFYMVAHNKRAQMQQLIFARNDLRPRVSDIKLYAENTGLFHIFPNKGGLCVSLNVDFTRLAFISCHLAAHEGVDKCAIRNSSVQEILSSVTTESDIVHHTFFMGDMNYRCTFNKDTPETIKEKSNSGKSNSSGSSKKKAKETPAVNMEEESDVDDDDGEGEGDTVTSEKKKNRQAEMNKLHTMVTKEKWTELLALDELSREMAAKRVLCDYKALTPLFPPTFKRIRDIGIQRNTLSENDDDKEDARALSDVDVDVTPDNINSNGDESNTTTTSSPKKHKQREYNLSMSDTKGDSRSLTKGFYHHKRLPSYTDRILTSSMPGFASLLEAVSFNSCEDACSSDHKPVIGVFKLTPRGGLKDIMSYSPSYITQGTLHYSSSTTYRVKNLEASNLTEMDSQIFGGGSDPYCIFSADPVGILVGNVKKMRTRAINHDLNPKWIGDEINFRLATNDIQGLSRNCHFLFSVWDYDVGNPDDLIGSAAIPLASVFEHFANTDAEDFQFELELLRDGQPHGFLTGAIEVGGMKDINSMVAYASKKESKTLYETLKSQNEAAAKHGSLGCQCTVA